MIKPRLNGSTLRDISSQQQKSARCKLSIIAYPSNIAENIELKWAS